MLLVWSREDDREASRRLLAGLLEPLGWDGRLERTPLGGLKTGWRPELELSISLSRTRGASACVIGRGCVVGVDIEAIENSVDSLSIAQMQFDPVAAALVSSLEEPERTRCFFDFWTLNEAALKALGVGFARQMPLVLGQDPPRISGCEPPGQFWQAFLPPCAPGLSLAVASLADVSGSAELYQAASAP